jgi:hypothetical protein
MNVMVVILKKHEEGISNHHGKSFNYYSARVFIYLGDLH